MFRSVYDTIPCSMSDMRLPESSHNIVGHFEVINIRGFPITNMNMFSVRELY